MDKRIVYLDVAKFIGLLLVCFCHIPMPEGNFHVWVYSFHMPLFFLISGIFFSPDKFSVGKSAKQLLIPFLIFNIIACIISMLIGIVSTGTLKLPIISNDIIVQSHYVIGPSWFLISLFSMRVFCGLILRYFSKRALVGSALAIVGAFLITAKYPFWDFLSLGSTVLGLPFYLLGFYFKTLFLEVKYISKWWLSVAALGLSIPAIYNGQIGIHVHDFGYNILLFIIFGLSGSLLIISLSRLVKIPGKILSIFMDGALFIICFHTLIFEYLILVWNKMTNDFSGNTLTEKIVITLCTFIISYPLILLMLRYTPFLLGKPRRNHKRNVIACK